VKESVSSPTRSRSRVKARIIARAIAESAACELLILAGCCLLVVIQTPAASAYSTHEPPSFWFTLWGPFFLVYEFPVQAAAFLIVAGTLRSLSLLHRSAGRLQQDYRQLRLIQGGLSEREPELAGTGGATDDEEDSIEEGPSLDRAA
jgi:hypothetical protein